jgi:hypothetical protein
MTSNLTKFFAISAIVALAGTMSLPLQAQTLQGGVLQEDIYKNQPAGLNRGDIQGDPFRGNANDNAPVDQMLELPPGAMDVQQLRAPAPPKKTMQASASDQGNFNGQQMMPQMESVPQQPKQMMQPPMRSGAQQEQRNDPDGSAEMQLLWDAWHKRVAESIFARFNSLAQMAFKHSPPLACQVSYMVARDGRVGNVQVLQKSSNPIFNTMLLGVINSMNGNPVLEYPPNSRRQFVEKTGTFTWNYGQQGFKYTTGDSERIQQRIPAGQNQQMRPMNQMQQPQQMRQMQQPMQQPMQMMQNMFR